MTAPDPKLREYAKDDRQWELFTAYCRHRSERKAAVAMGCHCTTIHSAKMAILARAAQHGYAPDYDMIHPTAPGFRLKGTSTLYDDLGNVRAQWVKTTVDQEQQDAAFKAAVDAMMSDVRPLKPVKEPKTTTDDLLACYPIGDHHLGMMAWHAEAGEDYDLSIGEAVLMRAVDYLVNLSPNCEQALLAVLGDFLHIDSFKAVTPTSGYLLDADSRYPKMVFAAVRVLKYAISALLRKHKRVRIIYEPGNHDPSSAIFMMALLASSYENEPRVSVDTSVMPFRYFQFGKNMIATNHGDKIAIRDMASVIAADQPKMWGETEHRYCWLGHVHHHQSIETKGKELRGITVETFQVLAPRDAHAAGQGYQAHRSMKSIVLHREYGEEERHTFNPARFA